MHQLGRSLMETLFERPAVDRSRRPDVASVSAARWPLRRRAPRDVNAWPVVPDLAVEIVSPTNTANEVMEEIDEYFTAGARRVWVVFPEQSLVYDYESPTSVRVPTADDVLDGGELLPEFRLPLRGLFGDAEEV
jgi:Uma2 family endonuclease